MKQILQGRSGGLLLRLLLLRHLHRPSGLLRSVDGRVRQRIVQRLPLGPEGQAAANYVADAREHRHPTEKSGNRLQREQREQRADEPEAIGRMLYQPALEESIAAGLAAVFVAATQLEDHLARRGRFETLEAGICQHRGRTAEGTVVLAA